MGRGATGAGSSRPISLGIEVVGGTGRTGTKRLLALTVGLALVCAIAFGSWEDARSRYVFPYFQTGGNWCTLLIFVSGSEESEQAVYIRFCDSYGNFCLDTTSDGYAFGANEQLIFSTRSGVGTHIPTTACSGYVKFRSEGSGFGDSILAYAVVYSAATGSGFVIPSVSQPASWKGPPQGG